MFKPALAGFLFFPFDRKTYRTNGKFTGIASYGNGCRIALLVGGIPPPNPPFVRKIFHGPGKENQKTVTAVG